MFPRWHILLGLIFSLLWKIIFPNTELIYIVIIFLASVLVDFDHYLTGVRATGRFELSRIFEYYKKRQIFLESKRLKGIKQKDYLQIFHTVEFHLGVLLLGIFVWSVFLYIFAGMMFHSVVDFIDLYRKEWVYGREFWLTIWLVKKIKN